MAEKNLTVNDITSIIKHNYVLYLNKKKKKGINISSVYAENGTPLFIKNTSIIKTLKKYFNDSDNDSDNDKQKKPNKELEIDLDNCLRTDNYEHFALFMSNLNLSDKEIPSISKKPIEYLKAAIDLLEIPKDEKEEKKTKKILNAAIDLLKNPKDKKEEKKIKKMKSNKEKLDYVISNYFDIVKKEGQDIYHTIKDRLDPYIDDLFGPQMCILPNSHTDVSFGPSVGNLFASFDNFINSENEQDIYSKVKIKIKRGKTSLGTLEYNFKHSEYKLDLVLVQEDTSERDLLIASSLFMRYLDYFGSSFKDINEEQIIRYIENSYFLKYNLPYINTRLNQISIPTSSKQDQVHDTV